MLDYGSLPASSSSITPSLTAAEPPSQCELCFILLSEDTRERRSRINQERESHKTPFEVHYGLQVAEMLDQFVPEQKAVSKVLMEIEFPGTISPPPYNHYGPEF